jgi:hypothetical protein
MGPLSGWIGVVDELAGGVVRAILSLFHSILQAIFEALFRVLFEIVATTIGRILSVLFRPIAYLGRIALWAAGRAYEALFARIQRIASRRMIAHGIVVGLLMAGAFAIGFGASTVYHLTPTYAAAASLSDQR